MNMLSLATFTDINATRPPARYWAITGRIPGDQQDSMVFAEADTGEEALAIFEQEMWCVESLFADPDDFDDCEEELERRREAVQAKYGACVVVNAMIASETPIEIDW